MGKHLKKVLITVAAPYVVLGVTFLFTIFRAIGGR